MPWREITLLLVAAASCDCARTDRKIMIRPAQISIGSVDYAPAELDEQVPLRGSLLKEVPGDDRPDYWIVKLDRPVSWLKDGTARQIRYLVVAARWVGTSIKSGATLPVAISYVIDESQVSDDRLHFAKAEYVAIGMAKVD